jgi:carbonic anhydrase
VTDTGDLVARNAEFAARRFAPGLTISPSGNLMVIGCVDPRVDPARVLDIGHGEAAVIRNVGGRITPSTLRTLAMLGVVGRAHAGTRPPGTWHLVILHHTDCGMTDIAAFPELLAEYFEIPEEELPDKHVLDPRRSVRADVGTITATTHAPDFLVSGLVYDVDTGLVDVVVPETALSTG